ncbi:BppU family phage baseplate upper protein [Peptostreptococcus faecalis]|uniref:BppU family phage baseplate upper protein n=1 Tax=Peptostreptococcus faecalis TaxID=2045015 RepID=UPI000C7D49D4|nr:BppU family phage baseplate upper protein [Peptostreptococcus faecalis]
MTESINKDYPLIIDLLKSDDRGLNKGIMFNESDKNTAFVNAQIVRDEVPVNLVGAIIYLNVDKPNRTKLQVEVEIENPEEGKVKLPFSENTLNFAGLASFQLQIEVGDKTSITPKYYFTIETGNITDEDIMDSNEYPILTKERERVEQALNNSKIAMERADNLLLTQIEANNKMNNAELIRKENELKRRNAETQRGVEFEDMKITISQELASIEKIVEQATELKKVALRNELNKDFEEKFNETQILFDGITNKKVLELKEYSDSQIEPVKNEIREKLKTIPPVEELKGRDGTSITLKGKVDNIDELPTLEKSSLGDIYVVGETLYMNNITEWVDIGGFRAGPQGLRGEPGKDGVNGKDGVDGKDGIDGKDGYSIYVKGTLTSEENLPSIDDSRNGDMYVINGELYLFTGENSWSNLGKFVGPQGLRGEPGKDGVNGKDGVDGKDGLTQDLTPITTRMDEIEQKVEENKIEIEIVDNLTTGGSNKVLSAEQGKVLFAQVSDIEERTGVVNNLEDGGIDKPLSAEMGKQLFQSVSDGKTKIASAITDKGISTSPTDTFDVMSGNIKDIKTGYGVGDVLELDSVDFEYKLDYSPEFLHKIQFSGNSVSSLSLDVKDSVLYLYSNPHITYYNLTENGLIQKSADVTKNEHTRIIPCPSNKTIYATTIGGKPLVTSYDYSFNKKYTYEGELLYNSWIRGMAISDEDKIDIYVTNYTPDSGKLISLSEYLIKNWELDLNGARDVTVLNKDTIIFSNSSVIKSVNSKGVLKKSLETLGAIQLFSDKDNGYINGYNDKKIFQLNTNLEIIWEKTLENEILSSYYNSEEKVYIILSKAKGGYLSVIDGFNEYGENVFNVESQAFYDENQKIFSIENIILHTGSNKGIVYTIKNPKINRIKIK